MKRSTFKHSVALRMVFVTLAIAICVAVPCLAAQAPATSKAKAKAPAQAPASPAPSTADDAARKAQIINSPRWRRAMFELNEWLSGQQIYTPEQVIKLKQEFTANVNRMNANQLELTLADLEAKFQIMQSPEAQDARAWLSRYLSILSDKKREEVLGKLPNLETMTAGQLQQVIAQIEGRKSADQAQAQQVEQLRDSSPNPWTQYTRMAEQAYVADHSPGAGGYSSPYSPGVGKRPFEGVKTGPSMGFYTTPYGGVGVTFGMGGW